MRIGTTMDSLDRIKNRFGDSPVGMAESAIEFLRIANHSLPRNHTFHEIEQSEIMIQAYRLVVSLMKKEGMDYPFI